MAVYLDKKAIALNFAKKHPLTLNFLPISYPFCQLMLSEAPNLFYTSSGRRYLKRTLDLNPSWIDGQMYLASSFLHIDRNLEASAAYQKALSYEPDNFDIWTQDGCAHFQACDYSRAVQSWHEGRLAQQRRASSVPQLKGIRMLGNSWFLAVGHIAHLDSYIKMQQLGLGTLSKADKPYALVHPNLKIPNSYLFSLFKKYFHIVDHPKKIPVPEKNISDIKDEFWTANSISGETKINIMAWAEAENVWDQQKAAPTISIPEQDRMTCRTQLEKIGLPKDAWFVTLHVREAGFHKDWNSTHPTFRDAKIETYFDAIKYITDKGGWVVRIGDPSMSKLPDMTNVIDYAHSSLKSEMLDIFLCSDCRYFLGTNSGMYFVAAAFGTKCIATNWAPLAFMPFHKNTISIPKLYWSLKEKRVLNLNEMFRRELAQTDFVKVVARFGVRAMDNTSEELRELVEEAFTNEKRISPALEKSFDDVAEIAGYYRSSRKGNRFLQKHRGLFLKTNTD